MIDPLSCTIFLFASFILAGAVQVAWFKSPWSRRFQRPLDRGRTFRGKPIFGSNKTWRGLMVMPLGVGCFFVLLSSNREWFGSRFDAGLWPLSSTAYFSLGCWAGLAFMLGELPNSFLKRQWDISPGSAPRRNWARLVCFLFDRIDSLIAAMAAIALFVHVPLSVWVTVLLVGIFIHWSFSAVLKLVGVKPRAA